jgi:hypothetical protein
MKLSCEHFEHARCFYSFGTKIVRDTVVLLVYDSLLQHTTTYVQ